MIGNNIKKLRILNNLTQKQLAEKSNITRESVGNYERGDRIPPSDILNKIAIALNVSVNDLIKDDTVNISDMNNDDMNFYIECIIEKPELKPLINIFKNNGYTLHQELKGSNIHLLKDGKEKAYISEKDFINFGMSMINNINEFTEFQFNKLLDIFTLLS